MWPGRREHEMRLFEFAFLFDQNRSGRTRFARLECLRPHRRATLTTVKRSADQFKQTCVIHVSGRCYDEIVVRKLARVKTYRSLVVESRNSLPRTFDWTAEWLVREIRRVEELSEELVRRVLDHLHLFEDYFLFAFEVFLVKTRVCNQVGE